MATNKPVFGLICDHCQLKDTGMVDPAIHSSYLCQSEMKLTTFGGVQLLHCIISYLSVQKRLQVDLLIEYFEKKEFASLEDGWEMEYYNNDAIEHDGRPQGSH